ncbi:MAG TPA: hypothetical protein VN810_03835 [Terriglobales bacterium]|nr:hypothetical protein [Terriglobales bacterium]
MTLFWSKAAVIATSLLFLPACSAAQTTAAPKPGTPVAPPASKVATAKQRKHATSKPPAAPAPQTQPLPPPAPLTPEQMPAAPPQVTYNNGLLSIVATNSTLSDILHAVSTRTGATVDAPAQLTRERVAARIGPATPREVLSDLLTGPRFDYILVGSDGDPNAVRSIILTANQSSPSAGAAMAQPPPVRAAMPPQVDDDEAEEDQPAPPQPATPPAQPAQQAQPGPRTFMPQQPPDQVGGPPPASGEGGQQVKSPEQLLQQLRRMQQPGNPPPDAR